jgi:hypothetical protein
MADLALVTADKVQVVSVMNDQLTITCGEDIVAGAPVYLKAADGKFYNGDGNAAPANVNPYGVATHTAKSGQALTAIRRGIMDGWDLSGMNFGETVYLSDTVGRLADAAGTFSAKVGIVIPGGAVPLGTAFDKLLKVECQIGDV